MNAPVSAESFARPRISPLARRLARERDLEPSGLSGTGPGGRIVAADVLAWRAPVAPPEAPEPAAAPPVSSALTVTFIAQVSLGALTALLAEAAAAGVTLEIEDVGLRAAEKALDVLPGGGAVALEQDGRQAFVGPGSGTAIGTARRLRLGAKANGSDVGSKIALASLKVLTADRSTPVTLPLLPGRALRLLLVVRPARVEAQVLLSADPGSVGEDDASTLLDAFAALLEQPLALLA